MPILKSRLGLGVLLHIVNAAVIPFYCRFLCFVTRFCTRQKCPFQDPGDHASHPNFLLLSEHL